ncbi:MAG: nicotinate phosphoribosyltransferase [Bacilli bacterium]|nr:nicotinate phosphoribosyltransferase [Bacilli bacterium]
MNVDKNNYTMLCDFYELTMANAYFNQGMLNQKVYFDMFFRKVPDGGGFAIFAGLEQLVEYIMNLHFTEKDLEYLSKVDGFSQEFIEYLRNFKFTGDIYSVREGEVIFPNEPLITVYANAVEAQIIETYLLLAINHQSLIATKTNRIVRAAKGKVVMEFGARRAQGATAAILGSRAAYIAGVNGTSCAYSDVNFGIKALGTMAHSWVQMFDSEYEAFKTYCEAYPHNVVLLIDTYNVLKSGAPNAIKVIKEVLLPKGIRKAGVRIDSGDIAYLSKKLRKMFDDAGLDFVTICASNSLDERIIEELDRQDACIDSYGVGERLITSKSDPVFGGVYKLVAVEKEGEIIPKIKISENEAKITNPHFKKVYRLYGRDTDKALADVICLHDEEIDDTNDYEIFDPKFTWKRKLVYDFYKEELQVPIFKNGELVYKMPSLEEIRAYREKQVECQWDEVKRFDNPHEYYVDLSQKLWDIKHDLLKNNIN